MEACPIELQLLIFSFACTDDGSTGRSLSLVSRAFYELSYPYQWNSLAIRGYPQAVAFAKLLYSLQPTAFSPPRVPRAIHNLFVSTRTEHAAHDNIIGEPPDAWVGVLCSILRYAAPTLQTLSIVCFESTRDCAAILSHALRVRYPALTELTIRGRCMVRRFPRPTPIEEVGSSDSVTVDDRRQSDKLGEAKEGGDKPRTWQPIPTLRRLHIACTFQGMTLGTHAEHTFISELAPELTHLRLSVLDLWGSRRIAEILHAECAENGMADPLLEVFPVNTLAHLTHPLQPIGNGANAAAAGDPDVRVAKRVTWDRVLPSTNQLELFAFQPPPTESLDFYCSCCMDVRGDRDVMRVFEALARGSDGRFLLVPCCTREGYGFSEALADWLGRMGGSQGCWGADRQDSEPPVAVDAARTPPHGEEALDVARARRKQRRASSLQSIKSALQKAKFW
ncbi:hypothetical protein GY45DRAFT_1244036 [Cubamyces sp. BRFM 1775]|nr:hypothetical protein GY45DRAFT_1244036 [Cubamyces sp. BRFM 1775]